MMGQINVKTSKFMANKKTKDLQETYSTVEGLGKTAEEAGGRKWRLKKLGGLRK